MLVLFGARRYVVCIDDAPSLEGSPEVFRRKQARHFVRPGNRMVEPIALDGRAGCVGDNAQLRPDVDRIAEDLFPLGYDPVVVALILCA